MSPVQEYLRSTYTAVAAYALKTENSPNRGAPSHVLPPDLVAVLLRPWPMEFAPIGTLMRVSEFAALVRDALIDGGDAEALGAVQDWLDATYLPWVGGLMWEPPEIAGLGTADANTDPVVVALNAEAG